MPERAVENVFELLEAQVERAPDKEFLTVESDGRVFTYRQFQDAVNRAASTLLFLGTKRGDRVSLLLTNRAEYLIFYFACFKLGAWAGPVNSLLKPKEIEFIVSNSEASVAVTETDLLSRLDQTRARVPSLRAIVVIEASGQWSVIESKPEQDLVSAIDDAPASGHQPPATNDEAVIIYTSGTTGKPKGVLLTHGNLLSNAKQIAEWLALTEEDRALMIMPLFHVNALMATGLAVLWSGGSIVLSSRFSATRLWETVSRFGVTYFGSVATMLSMLNHAHPDGVPEGLDASRFRFALCGSAPVPVSVLNTFESMFHFPVIEGYGLSESTCRSTFNPIDERRRVGSVGLPIGNDVRIFDDNDRPLGPNQIGEIVLRGPNIMKGYYKDDDATREAFRSGWFHTGDLGYRDSDGFYYIVDRKSDLIIRGGENIYPREIDEVLYQHPKVSDAATVGFPDELYGEAVKSFVVLREGESSTEEEIIDFCREQLADFKCPKTVQFVTDIPKGPTGKVLRRELTGVKREE
jgi:long-chain acyl-CoA synthetase